MRNFLLALFALGTLTTFVGLLIAISAISNSGYTTLLIGTNLVGSGVAVMAFTGFGYAALDALSDIRNELSGMRMDSRRRMPRPSLPDVPPHAEGAPDLSLERLTQEERDKLRMMGIRGLVRVIARTKENGSAEWLLKSAQLRGVWRDRRYVPVALHGVDAARGDEVVLPLMSIVNAGAEKGRQRDDVDRALCELAGVPLASLQDR